MGLGGVPVRAGGGGHPGGTLEEPAVGLHERHVARPLRAPPDERIQLGRRVQLVEDDETLDVTEEDGERSF
jgi:hypothetical protein